MKETDIVQELRCCAEGECKDCAMHEDKQRCQENLLDKAAEAIELLTAENADLRKEIEWKDMVIALAQRKQAEAEAERDAASADLADVRSCKTCKYACDTRDCSSCKSKTCKCRECHLDKNAWEWRCLPEAPEEGEKDADCQRRD